MHWLEFSWYPIGKYCLMNNQRCGYAVHRFIKHMKTNYVFAKCTKLHTLRPTCTFIFIFPYNLHSMKYWVICALTYPIKWRVYSFNVHCNWDRLMTLQNKFWRYFDMKKVFWHSQWQADLIFRRTKANW